MKIYFNKDWRICSDTLQWIVQKRRTVKGKDKWDSLSYHNILDTAVYDLAENQIRYIEGDYPQDAVEILWTALDRIQKDIRSMLQKKGKHYE